MKHRDWTQYLGIWPDSIVRLKDILLIRLIFTLSLFRQAFFAWPKFWDQWWRRRVFWRHVRRGAWRLPWRHRTPRHRWRRIRGGLLLRIFFQMPTPSESSQENMHQNRLKPVSHIYTSHKNYISMLEKHQGRKYKNWTRRNCFHMLWNSS